MSKALKPASGQDVYTIVTDRIIKQLEGGTIPWHTCWSEQGQPENLITRRPYTNLNTWLLASLGYERNLFLTWNQIRKQGLSVKIGQKGHMVVYWVPGTEKLRYNLVFNVAQTNIPPDKIPPPIEAVADLETVCKGIFSNMPKKPALDDWGSSLFYNPETDTIHMPAPEFVPSPRDYYSALFYALIHSTAHPDRLNRPECMTKPLTPKQYDHTELMCEMGSSFLCSMAGMPSRFLKTYSCETEGWLLKFSTDKKMVVDAAASAQQAVQYILNTTWGDTTDEEIM